MVGFNLAPPENAIALCVDEKPQIKVLDQTTLLLPMQAGKIARRTHDYKRDETTTIFAALGIATGRSTGFLKPNHQYQEFLSFLCQPDRTYPDQ